MNNALKKPVINTTLNVKPKIGFAGVGWIGLNRMKSMVENNLVEVKYIADPVETFTTKAKEISPGAEITNILDNLLDKDIDGIVISTPSALHARQSILALESGYSVFCQKPLGRTREETESVIKSARDSDRLLAVDLSYRHLAAVRKIKSLIDEGNIGDVFAANLVFHNAYGPEKEWFYNYSLSGGGCVIDLGIHLVDLVLWMFDFPDVSKVSSRLYAKGSIINKGEKKVEDYASARFDLSNGVTVNLTCSWHLSVGYNAVIEASFYGTKGGLSVKNVNGSYYDFFAELYKWTAREIIAEPPDDWGPRAAIEWAKQLAKSNLYNTDIECVLNTAEVLDLIYHR